MVIDSTLGLLFWCNFETIEGGSIERINFDGGNRYVKHQGCHKIGYGWVERSLFVTYFKTENV